jgi:acetyl esterase/lipase
VDALMWRPRNATDPLPVVLAFHGGAFIVGGPLGAERIAVPLAAEHAV